MNLILLQLYEGETIKPVENAENPLNPVIHRQYIYFLSSKQTKEKFMMNPIKYIRQPKPKASMPVRIMIVGPPKSGKTTGECVCLCSSSMKGALKPSTKSPGASHKVQGFPWCLC